MYFSSRRLSIIFLFFDFYIHLYKQMWIICFISNYTFKFTFKFTHFIIPLSFSTTCFQSFRTFPFYYIHLISIINSMCFIIIIQ